MSVLIGRRTPVACKLAAMTVAPPCCSPRRSTAATRNFAGTVQLIIQPAEKGLAGAKAMLQDGQFERFPCDAVYAIHNSPDMPLGTVKALEPHGCHR
jgi:hypothetical protein